MAEGDGGHGRRELGFPELWDLLNELKNQLGGQIRDVEREVSRANNRLEIMAERYQMLLTQVGEVRQAALTAQAKADTLDRFAIGLEAQVKSLTEAIPSGDELRDMQEAGKGYRADQADARTIKLTRQNLALTVGFGFLFMGLLAPHLPALLHALVGGP